MIDTGYLPGRFEFLHYANIAWIVKSRLRFQRLRLVLLPGSSDWFLEDFVVALRIEGRVAAEEDVEHHAAGPEVAFRVVIVL